MGTLINASILQHGTVQTRSKLFSKLFACVLVPSGLSVPGWGCTLLFLRRLIVFRDSSADVVRRRREIPLCFASRSYKLQLVVRESNRRV